MYSQSNRMNPPNLRQASLILLIFPSSPLRTHTHTHTQLEFETLDPVFHLFSTRHQPSTLFLHSGRNSTPCSDQVQYFRPSQGLSLESLLVCRLYSQPTASTDGQPTASQPPRMTRFLAKFPIHMFETFPQVCVCVWRNDYRVIIRRIQFVQKNMKGLLPVRRRGTEIKHEFKQETGGGKARIRPG